MPGRWSTTQLLTKPKCVLLKMELITGWRFQRTQRLLRGSLAKVKRSICMSYASGLLLPAISTTGRFWSRTLKPVKQLVSYDFFEDRIVRIEDNVSGFGSKVNY